MKSKPTQARMQQSVSGLALSSDGRRYSIDTSAIEPSSNIFPANQFRLKRRKNDLLLLFGSTSDFDDHPANFDLAIQLEMPIGYLADGLILNIWDKKSFRTEQPLSQHIEEALDADEKAWAQDYECNIALPDRNVRDRTFRKFPVSVAMVTWSDRRGFIEFFEVSAPSMVAMHTGSPRKGDAIKSLLTVVMEAKLLYAFLLAVRKELPDYQEILRQQKEAP